MLDNSDNSEAYLSAMDSILSLGPVVAVVWELSENWPVRFISPNIARYGYAPDDFMSGNLPWVEIIHPEDVDRISVQVSEAMASGAGRSEQRYRIRTSDGENRWIVDYTTFIRDKKGRAHTAQGVLIDATTEHHLSEVRQAQLRFFNENPHPYFQLVSDCQIGFANEAAHLLFAEVEASSALEQQRFSALCEEWLAAEDTVINHYAITDRIFWVRVDPGADGESCNVYTVDVTEHRKRELFLEELADNIAGLVIRYRRTSAGEDFVEVVNPQRLSAFGLSRSRLPDGSADIYWDLLMPECVAVVRASFDRSARDLTDWHQEFQIIDEAGIARWVEGSGVPLRHTDGSTSWTLILRDISEEHRTRDALATAMEQTIRMLSDAVEMRDAYTAGHQNSVSDIAVAIANELALDAHVIEGVRLAAAVHDIGKIRIPLEILSKPDRLTSIEYELIKGHSSYGAEILSSVQAPWPLADIVRQHHERMDGSGYPDGLKGDEILLEARIIAVADVLESISSDRPYRAARGIAVARQELVRGRETLYDPRVVDAALALIDRGDLQPQPSVNFRAMQHAPASQV